VGSDSPEVITEPESGVVRSVFAVHRSSPVVARLARDPRILGAVMQILGSPAYVHQSRINFKPAFRGREFYWHSDFETWHVEDGMPRMRAVSLSLNLLENNTNNGPLMLVPDSHRHYVACAGRTPERHYEQSLRRQEYGVPEPAILEELVRRGGIVAPVGPPGSAVLFDCNVMHGSNGNITPWPRSNLFLVYNSVENALEEPFSGQAPRPEHIASRDFTALVAGA
jgi:ectoine hydroxylase